MCALVQQCWHGTGILCHGWARERARRQVRNSNVFILSVPDHDRGRPIEVNACILITHMVYL